MAVPTYIVVIIIIMFSIAWADYSIHTSGVLLHKKVMAP